MCPGTRLQDDVRRLGERWSAAGALPGHGLMQERRVR